MSIAFLFICAVVARSGCTFVTQFATAYTVDINANTHPAYCKFRCPYPTTRELAMRRGRSCVHVHRTKNIWTGFPATNNNTTRQIHSIAHAKIRKIVYEIIYELNASIVISILYAWKGNVIFTEYVLPIWNYCWVINTIAMHVTHFV